MRALALFISFITTMLIASPGQAQAADGIYHPPPPGAGEWERCDAAGLGIAAADLAELDRYLAGVQSSAFIILHRGRILHEAYYNGADASTSGPVYSVSKTMVAYLTLRCQEQGLLDLDDAVSTHLGAGWSRADAAQEARIRVRHLISMTSGLDDHLGYVGPAGSIWHYNTGAYHKLHEILAVVTKQKHQQFSKQLLFDPIGMQSRWNITNRRIICNGRDMARFGLLLLREGRWADSAPPSAQIASLWTPSQQLNPSYGQLTWLNNPAGHLLPRQTSITPGKLWPDAPDDLFAAMGKDDKRIYVVPSMDLVIIRHGEKAYASRLARSQFDQELWARLQPLLRALRTL